MHDFVNIYKLGCVHRVPWKEIESPLEQHRRECRMASKALWELFFFNVKQFREMPRGKDSKPELNSIFFSEMINLYPRSGFFDENY